MALRFRPADTTFYDLFAQSARHLVDGAALLAEMLGEGNDREGIAQRMRDAEHAADETTHEIIRRVNSTFVTPFDREDIYSLASGLDDVMDFMEEAVDLTLLYEVVKLPSELANQVEVHPAVRRARPPSRCRGCARCRTSRSTGSRSTGWRTSATRATGGSWPSCSAASTKPSRCMKLKDVVDSLEAAIDAFETVANIVEQIAVKES